MVVKKKSKVKKAKIKKTRSKKASARVVKAKVKSKARAKATKARASKRKKKVKPKKIKTKRKITTKKKSRVKVKPKKIKAEKATKTKATAKPTPTVIGVLVTPYKLKKGEEYMNETQKEHFRKILMLWKEQLMSEVDHTVVHLKEDAIVYPDPLDRAVQEDRFNLELRTRDRERKLIKKIEQALDLINMGEYGYCEDCGAEIGIRRLEARPTADKCIDCKTYEEIREKQVGS